jgi:hydrogenase nickel incorporation protein HypB
LREAAPGVEVAVIEGDQQTSRDAERIRALGVEAVQINTGRGCHLDAATVGSAFGRLSLHSHSRGGMLFIENVGNLVCPALWDLGEDAKVVVVSVTEGEDKPLKYPDMFAASSLMVVNKIDLLPHVSFDVSACVGFARRVNPWLEVVEVSARSGEGVGELVAWLLGRGRQVHAHAQEHAQEHAHAHEHEYEYDYAHAHEQEQEQEHAHEQEHAQEPEHGGT